MQKVKLKLCRALTGSSLSHCIQPIDQSTTKSVMHCRCSVRPMIGFQLPGITAFWPVPNCTVSPESHQEANTQSPSGNFNVLIISLPPHTHLKDPLGILEFCLLQFYYNLYWGCSNDSTMNHVVSICWLTKFEVVCNQRGKWQCTQAPCGPQVCKNRACSISGPEVVMGIPNQGMLGQFLYFSFVFIGCMWYFVLLFLVVSTSAIDCLERLVSKMTYHVSSEKLNPTHSLMQCTQLAGEYAATAAFVKWMKILLTIAIQCLDIYSVA